MYPSPESKKDGNFGNSYILRVCRLNVGFLQRNKFWTDGVLLQKLRVICKWIQEKEF